MKGLFITVEGMDGCGKTTQLSNIVNYLKERGKEVITTREPGGTDLGEQIRTVLLDIGNKNMNSVAELMLYAAARAQLVEKLIKPALEEGKIVICDRFVDSSIVYQGYGRNLGVKMVEEINMFALQGCNPDLTLFFDISPDEVMGRKIGTEKEDRMEAEAMEFHNRVYSGYIELAERNKERIKIINARKTIEEVFSEVKNLLDRHVFGKV